MSTWRLTLRVNRELLWTIILGVLMHDREELQLGPAGAPLAQGVLLRPRGRRIVAVHVNDPLHPVVSITRP